MVLYKFGMFRIWNNDQWGLKFFGVYAEDRAVETYIIGAQIILKIAYPEEHI